jgi:hypothetical protein
MSAKMPKLIENKTDILFRHPRRRLRYHLLVRARHDTVTHQ